MKYSLTELKTQLSNNLDEISRINNERARLGTATSKAWEAQKGAQLEMDRTRAAYTQAVVSSPGSKEERGAYDEMVAAQRTLALAEERLRVLKEAFDKASDDKRLSDLRAKGGELRMECWKRVAEVEAAQIPADLLIPLKRGFAAAKKFGDPNFAGFVGFILGPMAPDRDELQALQESVGRAHEL